MKSWYFPLYYLDTLESIRYPGEYNQYNFSADILKPAVNSMMSVDSSPLRTPPLTPTEPTNMTPTISTPPKELSDSPLSTRTISGKHR